MEITNQMLLDAKTYLPLAEKIAFVEKAAARCQNLVRITGESETQTNALPSMHMENTERKMRYMMYALLHYYLGIEELDTEADGMLLSMGEYDEYAKDHPLNQIERKKQNAEVREVCFDLMHDYRVLEKMLNAEVYGMLQVQNDPVSRWLSYQQNTMTPEYMQALAGELKDTQDQFYELMNKRQGGGANGG